MPLWHKGLALIDLGLYRRFYRQNRTSFADAELARFAGVNDFFDLIINHLQAYLSKRQRTASEFFSNYRDSQRFRDA
jgi:hypothetical protein